MQRTCCWLRGLLPWRGCLLTTLSACCVVAILFTFYAGGPSRDATSLARGPQPSAAGSSVLPRAATSAHRVDERRHATRDSAEPYRGTLRPQLRCGFDRRDAVLLHALPPGSLVSSRTVPLSVDHNEQPNNVDRALPEQFPHLRDVACPTEQHLLNLDAHEEDANVEQRTSHVTFKYQYYATRCNRTSGIMWRHLTPAVMREVTSRVVRLLAELYYHTERRNSTQRHFDPRAGNASEARHGSPLHVLDWASGCGAGTHEIQRAILREVPAAGSTTAIPTILGIELIKDAVQYAQAHYSTNGSAASGGIRFCQADGTKLHWIPNDSVDWIVSFGGLLHLPTSNNVMCRTIQQLLEKLSVGGILWTGYVDQAATLQALTSCNITLPRWAATSARCPVSFSSSRSEGGDVPSVSVTVIRENIWWGNVGVSKVYRRRNPKSIVWQKVHW